MYLSQHSFTISYSPCNNPMKHWLPSVLYRWRIRGSQIYVYICVCAFFFQFPSFSEVARFKHGSVYLVVALLWGFCFLQFFLPWLLKATCIAGRFFGCNYLAVPSLQPRHHWCCCMCVLPATSVSQDSLNKGTNPWRVTFLEEEIEIRRKLWLHRGEAIRH